MDAVFELIYADNEKYDQASISGKTKDSQKHFNFLGDFVISSIFLKFCSLDQEASIQRQIKQAMN